MAMIISIDYDDPDIDTYRSVDVHIDGKLEKQFASGRYEVDIRAVYQWCVDKGYNDMSFEPTYHKFLSRTTERAARANLGSAN